METNLPAGRACVPSPSSFSRMWDGWSVGQRFDFAFAAGLREQAMVASQFKWADLGPAVRDALRARSPF